MDDGVLELLLLFGRICVIESYNSLAARIRCMCEVVIQKSRLGMSNMKVPRGLRWKSCDDAIEYFLKAMSYLPPALSATARCALATLSWPVRVGRLNVGEPTLDIAEGCSPKIA